MTAGFALLGLWIVASCGTNSPSNCQVGSVLSCAGVNGCVGSSACSGSPAAWGACTCQSTNQPDSGIHDSGEFPSLGTGCQKNSDCPPSAFCLGTGSQLFFGGQPPLGVCAAACDAMAGCSAFAGAVCVNVDDPGATGDAGQGGQGICFESCTIGGSAASKCGGLAHVACAPLGGATGAGYCRPVCSINADCPSGACDPVRGVCVSSAVADTTFGLRCSAGGDAGGGPTLDASLEAATSDGAAADVPADAADGAASSDAGAAAPKACGDVCVQLDSTSDVCSRRCVFGSTDECGPSSGGLRRGACLFVTKGGSIGDLGYCGELCDCNDDCIEPTFVCDAFSSTDLSTTFGRKGVCTPPELVLNRPLPCGD